MDGWGVVSIVLFVIFVISIPVYVIFLCAIIKYRKHHPFNSAFFAICFVMGIIDIISLLRTWIFIRFARYAWFGLDVIIKRYPRGLAKLVYMMSVYTLQVQFNLTFVMALNRYAAIVTPMLYRKKWKKKNCVKYLVTSTLLPMIVCLPQLFTEHIYTINNQTEKIEGTKMTDRSWVVVYYFYWLSVFILQTSITGTIYGLLFWKRHVTKKRETENSNDQDRSDMKYAFVGVSLFMVMAGRTISGCLFAFNLPTATLYFIINLVQVLSDVLGWVNLWTLLAVSETVREGMISTLKCMAVSKRSRVTQVKIRDKAVTPAVKYAQSTV